MGCHAKGLGFDSLSRALLFPDPFFVSPVVIEESYILRTELQGWRTLPA
jgi:hypothetical protein